MSIGDTLRLPPQSLGLIPMVLEQTARGAFVRYLQPPA